MNHWDLGLLMSRFVEVSLSFVLNRFSTLRKVIFYILRENCVLCGCWHPALIDEPFFFVPDPSIRFLLCSFSSVHIPPPSSPIMLIQRDMRAVCDSASNSSLSSAHTNTHLQWLSVLFVFPNWPLEENSLLHIVFVAVFTWTAIVVKPMFVWFEVIFLSLQHLKDAVCAMLLL